jgi:hypothetical protein
MLEATFFLHDACVTVTNKLLNQSLYVKRKEKKKKSIINWLGLISQNLEIKM